MSYLSELINPPLLLPAAAALAALHILTAAFSKSKLVCALLALFNAALHVAAATYLAAAGASPKKLFLLLLVSAAVGLFVTGRKKREGRSDGI